MTDQQEQVAEHTIEDHEHAPDCGHPAVEHDGHTDYEHGGHLHHLHDDHYDEHASADTGR